MTNEKIDEILKKGNKTIILLYDNDVTLKHGFVAFHSDPSAPQLTLLYGFISKNPFHLNYCSYILINENTNSDAFENLLKKLIGKYNRMIFYCTDFNKKQMNVIENFRQEKCYDLITQTFDLSSEHTFQRFFNKGNGNQIFGIYYISTSLLNLKKLLLKFENKDVHFQTKYDELSNEKIKENEDRKNNFAKLFQEYFNDEMYKDSFHRLPCTPLSLQSLIRTKFYNDLDFDIIMREVHKVEDTEKIELTYNLPKTSKDNQKDL